jgi:hypothetical protein
MKSIPPTVFFCNGPVGFKAELKANPILLGLETNINSPEFFTFTKVYDTMDPTLTLLGIERARGHSELPFDLSLLA